MQIRIVAVGKLKEDYLVRAVAEYSRRLLPYCRLSIEEVKDEPLPEASAGPGVTQALAREGERILRLLDQGPQTYVIALDVSGEEVTSEELAARLASLGLKGVSHLTFLIGGGAGLSPEVLAMADWRLSLSRLTFPHQLARVILLEQLYRAFRINRGEPYHR